MRVVRFTRNYGQEAAVEALYLNARGRWLIQMDGDLQHPPEEIPRLIAKKNEGYDVVYGVRQKRQDALFRVVASRAMQWTMRSMMEIELPDDVSTFRLMSAPIARLVAALPERRKFFSALLVWSGARIGTRERRPRAAARRGARTTASPSSSTTRSTSSSASRASRSATSGRSGSSSRSWASASASGSSRASSCGTTA